MLICLDIETTGLSPDRDKIIEVGAALVNLKTRKVEKKFETFINPGVPIPHSITHLTGITDEDVAKAPKIHEIKDELLEFLGDHPIMGHNINFDLDFLSANGIKAPGTRLDSMDIANIALPKEPSYSLEIIANKFGIPDVGKHRALLDAEVNIELMFKLFDKYFSENEEKIPEILELLEKSESNWAAHLIEASKTFNKEKFFEKITEKKSPSKLELEDNAIIELHPYEFNDLIPDNPEKKTIIATTHLPEDSEHIILDANQYLDEKLFNKLLKKSSFSPEETVFALKIIPFKHPIAKSDLTVQRELKDLWFENACSQHPKEIEKKIEESKLIIVNHGTLARLSFSNPDVLNESHLIVDQIDELYENIQRSLTSIYFEKRFMKSSLSDEIKDRLLMLFGYFGIMVQKYGDAFGLDMSEYHTSTIDWQKTEDLIEKIAKEAEEEPACEEKDLLIWLGKAIKQPQTTKISISLNFDKLPIFKTTPLNIGEILAAKVWAPPESLTLISPVITYKGEETPGTYLKKLLSIPENLKVEIKTETPPAIEAVNDLPGPKEAIFSEKADQKLKKLLPEFKGLTYILTGSQTSAEQIHHKLALPLKKEYKFRVLAQKASGGMGKIRKMIQGNPDQTAVIGTYDFWKATKPEITNLIIYKIPFPPPSKTPHLFSRNPFKDYTIPETALKLKKIALTAKEILSFDNRINF